MLGSRVRSPGGSLERLQNTFWSLFFCTFWTHLPVSPGISSASTKTPPIRGQILPAGTIHPHQAPSVWTGGNYFSSASTKTPPSVDKCHLRAPYIHTRHPLCGQAATISPPHPQKRPHPWTNATCGHHTSTPGTLCVDRRQLRAPSVHKRYPICGQNLTPNLYRIYNNSIFLYGLLTFNQILKEEYYEISLFCSCGVANGSVWQQQMQRGKKWSDFT